MTPITSSSSSLPVPSEPRIICYHQTHHTSDGHAISVRPLLEHDTGVTHVIIAAVHLNEGPSNITLNDDPPSAPKFAMLWQDMKDLQAANVKVLVMLGGAAQGSFIRLDGSIADFEAYYQPLQDMLRIYKFDGIDLDVEEEMTLDGIIRLIDRLRLDFGADFLITLAPVATALQAKDHLSGFDYQILEMMRGEHIAWYNTQFYNGWSSLHEDVQSYIEIAQLGWPMQKVVLGLCTSPMNASGFLPSQHLEMLFANLAQNVGTSFGGIMGWEYFNSSPGGLERPWEWATDMSALVKRHFGNKKAEEYPLMHAE